MDLDQALHFEREGRGYVVHYAIADVAAFVAARRPGRRRRPRARRDALRRRLQDPAAPDRRCRRARRRCCPTRCARRCCGRSTSTRPVRAPTSTSSGRGSGRGPSSTTSACRRRSTTARPTRSLAAAARGRRAAARSARPRAAASRCRCPSRRSRSTGDQWSLEFRSMIPAETWNAQISMLTGFAAASLMVYARVGLLRTLPPPASARPPAAPPDRPGRSTSTGRPSSSTPTSSARSTPRKPAEAAMITACARLLRGSGYVAFDGDMPGRPDPRRAGLRVRPRDRAAAPPRRPLRRGDLRRAVRRHRRAGLGAVASWPTSPTSSRTPAAGPRSTRRWCSTWSRPGCSTTRVGESFDGVVTDVDEKDPTRGKVTIQEPAVEARVTASEALPLGTEVHGAPDPGRRRRPGRWSSSSPERPSSPVGKTSPDSREDFPRSGFMRLTSS